ncbi:MAG: hypothetical protein H6618_03555 [Deltaproteobacteria bacterium]|nr:hypothetical protein [Deltaproteobacteria bacterium]
MKYAIRIIGICLLLSFISGCLRRGHHADQSAPSMTETLSESAISDRKQTEIPPSVGRAFFLNNDDQMRPLNIKLLGIVVDPGSDIAQKKLVTSTIGNYSEQVLILVDLSGKADGLNLSAKGRLMVEPDPAWSPTKRGRFIEKVNKINESGFVPDEALKLDEFLYISKKTPNFPKDMLSYKGKSVSVLSAKVDHHTIVFRGMKINKDALDQVFENGLDSPAIFRAKTTDPQIIIDEFLITDLSRHSAQGSQTSAAISTSLDQNVAISFAGTSGFLLKIRANSENAVDLNKLIGDHGYKHEKEISIGFFLEKTDIIGAYPVSNGKIQGGFIENPNFSQ